MQITGIRLDRLRLELDPPFNAAWDPMPTSPSSVSTRTTVASKCLLGTGSGDTMAGFEAFEDLFVGTDPTAISRHVRAIETLNFHAGRFWPLEAALWDLIGKIHDVPVSHLFGNVTDRLPAYMSTGELKSSEQRVESARQGHELGFRAMKIRVARGGLTEGVAAVRGVREALGPDFTILVDLNQSWRIAGDVEPALDVKTVRRTVAELAELEVFWVEEPLPYTDVAGLADLRRSSAARIAGGEMLPTFADALRLLEHDALDVYQMDVVLSLGLSRCRTFAELAQHRHRQFTPHTWTNGIGVLANLQVAAGVGGGPWFELPFDPDGWTPERRDFMLAEPLRVDADGCVAVPPRPGLGVVLDEDAVERWRVG